MRAVLDSNVLISAAISRGPAHRIVQAWFEREPFELIVCDALLQEVAEVLAQDRMRRWIGPESAQLYLNRLVTTADVRGDPPQGIPLTRDADDDFVVYLAREYAAEVIVSGDLDLLEWEEQQPPVVPPVAFERMIDSELK